MIDANGGGSVDVSQVATESVGRALSPLKPLQPRFRTPLTLLRV
jgi:hypothetical protein